MLDFLYPLLSSHFHDHRLPFHLRPHLHDLRTLRAFQFDNNYAAPRSYCVFLNLLSHQECGMLRYALSLALPAWSVSMPWVWRARRASSHDEFPR